MDLYGFRKGDVVELITACSKNDPDIKQYNRIWHSNPHKLIILRKLDEGNFLVAICKKTTKNSDLILVASKKEKLYVIAKKFAAVPEKFIKISNCYFENPQKNVDEIYQKHDDIIEEKRKAREIEEQKRIEAQKNRKERQKEIEAYTKAYDLAVMTNDKAKMREIVSIIGYVPGQSSKGYATASSKVSNKYFNPKPMHGGGFTPK